MLVLVRKTNGWAPTSSQAVDQDMDCADLKDEQQNPDDILRTLVPWFCWHVCAQQATCDLTVFSDLTGDSR